MSLPKNVYALPHPLAQHKLTLLRRAETKSKKFRELVSELAIMLVYEATRDLPLEWSEIETPLTTTRGATMAEKVGLIPIFARGTGHGGRRLGTHAPGRSVASGPVP